MHSAEMVEWSDLRFFLAVAELGSTTAAGKALRVSQSTVQRRLTCLEASIGFPLFTRSVTGYRLGPHGVDLLPLARQLGQAAEAFEQAARQSARANGGVLRLTCPEPVVARLRPLVERFEAQHPGVAVEFVTSDRYLDLTKGDADVAFRSGDTDAALTGRKVADSIWGVYASADYIARHGRPQRVEDLAAHHILSLDDSLANHRLTNWLKHVAPRAHIAGRSNSVLGLAHATRSGLGVAPLPRGVALDAGGLVELFGPVQALTRSWRLLTTPALRRTPRVAAFFDFAVRERGALKTVFG
jgi:DNA-binding transcriptional LysR family regulator